MIIFGVMKLGMTNWYIGQLKNVLRVNVIDTD